MTFDGFYYDNKWWWGTASLTREFNFHTPVNVFAFGALTAVEVSNGQGLAYVGIIEATIIDPNTGSPVNEATPILGQAFPSQNFANRVTSITWLFGSHSSSVNTIEYANASLNMLLWS